ncbi:M23 family metallopeptidase [Hamadaea tsunoensis]|uniref:M23 family metallopeptidase n=1 Tax=Hamadaea tsunoensis TaxID=53368 RepID=UPI0004834C05|nr:M23 family metallopeptidase [Hamadaea tsunoensis]
MDRRTLLGAALAAPLATLLVPGRALADPPAPPSPQFAPPLEIWAQPAVGTGLAYLPLTPVAYGQAEGSKVVAHLFLRNTGAEPVHVTGVSVVFPGLAQPVFAMGGVEITLADPIAPGEVREWTNVDWLGADQMFHSNEIYLATLPSATVRVEISADGYTEAATKTWELVAYPVGRPVPFAAKDLRQDEYASAVGRNSSGGADGGRVWAYQIGLTGYASGEWSDLLPGTDGTQNADFRAWNMPVRAVADGVVIRVANDVYENPHPHKAVFDPGQEEGNLVHLRHADGTTTAYHHLMHGSVTVVKGQSVTAGAVLGRVGNSGGSSLPHLRVQTALDSPVEAERYARPWPVRDAWLVERLDLAPWDIVTKVGPTADRGIPDVPSLIWPDKQPPHYLWPHLGQYLAIDWPPRPWLWGIDEARPLGFGPVALTARADGDGTLTTAVLRPVRDDRTVLADLEAGAFTEALAQAARSGRYPIAISSHAVARTIRYGAILAAGAVTASVVGVRPEEFGRRAATLAADGYQPLSVAVAGGLVAACFGRSAATATALLDLDGDTFDRAVDGCAVGQLSVAVVDGKPRYSGVVSRGEARVLRDLTETGLRAADLALQSEGAFLTAVAGYTVDGAARFTATWS